MKKISKKWIFYLTNREIMVFWYLIARNENDMKSIIKISEAASLAIHTMVMLASTDDRLVTTAEMSRSMSVSEAHLAKVLQRLTKVGIVNSVRGPGGGFKLSKPPDSITLNDIYESIDGEIPDSDCLYEQSICNRQSCIMGGLIGSVSEEIKKYFTTTSLSDLTEK